MKRNLLKLGTLASLLVASLSAMAIDPPQVPAQALVDGGKYVLMNKIHANWVTYRTSWDGAFVMGPFAGCGVAPAGASYLDYQLQAVANEDDTWSFVQITPAAEEGAEPDTAYVYLPAGSGNLNLGANAASWIVEPGTHQGYYHLTPGEGNNEEAMGYYVHLNNGKEYVVISYLNAPWFPDYAQKQEQDPEGGFFPVYDEERGVPEHADSTHLNWAFVNADALPVYIAKADGYAVVAHYEENYLAEPDFEVGFKVGYDAAVAIYESPEYTSDDIAKIKAILDAKVALYEEILKAEELNSTEDATLAGATEAAKAVFDVSADPEALNEAKMELLEAESRYSQGGGDYTTLGKNMSFEDLSAQNGVTTVNLAAPPTGWNLYLGGVQVTTAEEVDANGVKNWCGVNADCSGETKDGEYGFGIWTAGFPSVELSQTITGIENGTYTISAALMVGANGGGSRRTTQRIFGNLNSTYFASEAEYDVDLLDNSEVYGFADNVEPVTDTEMMPIEVRAYVYDGTLTFGLRTDGNIAAALRTTGNPQGGDGWFKVDNFRIMKEGYSVEDALAVLAHYVDILDDWYSMGVPMSAETLALLETEIETYKAIDASASAEDIDAAILGAKELLAEVNASVKAYEKLYTVIEQHWDHLATYQDFPGAETYGDIILEVETNYYDGLYSVEEVDEAIAQLEAALEACKMSEILVGKDVSYVIKNPSFEDLSNQGNSASSGLANAPKGWNVIINGDTCRTSGDFSSHGIANWCAINGGDGINVSLNDGTVVTQQPTEGSNLWGIWTPEVPEVELLQVLEGMPAGTYTMTADVMVQHSWAGNNMTTQRIFANGYIQMFGSEEAHAVNLPEDAKDAAAGDAAYPEAEPKRLTYAGYTCESGDPTTDLLKTMTVTFGIDETGIAKIGFRTNNIGLAGEPEGNGHGWFKVDNFTLFYDSEDIPTGVESIKTSGAGTTIASRQYFTIGGAQVAAPQKGVNIVKNIMSDGSVKVSKVFVK